MENKAKILLEQYERDGDYPKLKSELLLLYSVSGSLPPRHPFIDALVENTECASRDEGIYFADSIRDDEERTDWFNKMIEDYQSAMTANGLSYMTLR